jgi:hypothetical protein
LLEQFRAELLARQQQSEANRVREEAARRDADTQLLEEWRPAMDAHRAQKEAVRRRGQVLAKRRDPVRQRKAAAIRARRQREREELQQLRRRPPGPQLPEWLRHHSRLRAVEHDFAGMDLRDWWAQHRGAAEQLARRTEIPAALYGVVLVLLAFRGLGDVQVRIGWLAERLGYTERWLQRLLERFPGHVRRFRQLRRYVYLTRELGPADQFTRWLDGRGRAHRFVEIRPVLHLTGRGAELLLQRRAIADRAAWIAAGKPWALEAALQDLRRRLGRQLRAVRERIARAPRIEFTPYAVQSIDDTIISSPRARSAGGPSPPGRSGAVPPVGGAAERAPGKPAADAATRGALPVGSEDGGGAPPRGDFARPRPGQGPS